MKYLAIALVNLRAKLSYRGNEVIRIMVQLRRMLVSIWMWLFIYTHSASTINGFSLPKLIQYFIMVTILATLFSTAPIFRLSNQIRSGKFTTILIRPISVFWEWFAAQLGSQLLTIGFVLVALLMMIPFAGALKVLTITGYLAVGFLMFYTFTMFAGTLGFWLINMWPLRSAVNALFLILGGQYFPLSFLGKGLANWLQYNPFSLLTDVPARYFAGRITSSSLLLDFAALVIWLLLFGFCYRLLLARGSQQYEGVGA